MENQTEKKYSDGIHYLMDCMQLYDNRTIVISKYNFRELKLLIKTNGFTKAL